MTSGPASRVLAAFCALADGWLNEGPGRNPAKVDCHVHGGRFDAEELAAWRVKAPALRAACLAITSATDDGDAVKLDLSLAAVVVAGELPGERRDAAARRLADRVAFELARGQADADGDSLWAQALFSADELERDHRGGDIGDPREIRAMSMYSRKLDSNNMALWAVTWRQEFRARPDDFALPLPAPAGIPDSVLAGYAPDVGTGHEDDYERIVPEGGA